MWQSRLDEKNQEIDKKNQEIENLETQFRTQLEKLRIQKNQEIQKALDNKRDRTPDKWRFPTQPKVGQVAVTPAPTPVASTAPTPLASEPSRLPQMAQVEKIAGSAICEKVKSIPDFLKNSDKTINEFLKTDDTTTNQYTIKNLIQELELLNDLCMEGTATPDHQERMKTIEGTIFRLLCWVDRAVQDKPSHDDELWPFTQDQKKTMEEWAVHNAETMKKARSYEGEHVALEDFDPNDAVRQSDAQWIYKPLYQGNNDIAQDIERGEDNSEFGISDSSSATPSVIDDEATEANIANPYMLSRLICIQP